MLERRAPTSAPLRALAKSIGQYGSTSFPEALITAANFSAYRINKTIKSMFILTYGDFESIVVEHESSIRAAEFVVFFF